MTPAQLTLPPAVESVPMARRFVGEALREIGAAASCDDAEMLVSELATNAVLHARTPFTVEVTRHAETVRVCVLDASPRRPRLREYGKDATTGRGIRLIASLAVDWGISPEGRGKTVWFELHAAGGGAEVAAWLDEDVDLEALLAGDDDEDDAAVTALTPRSPSTSALSGLAA